MAHELHYKKDDDLYAIYSTITGNYIINWNTKNEIEKQWIDYIIEDTKYSTELKIKNRMRHIDEII